MAFIPNKPRTFKRPRYAATGGRVGGRIKRGTKYSSRRKTPRATDYKKLQQTLLLMASAALGKKLSDVSFDDIKRFYKKLDFSDPVKLGSYLKIGFQPSNPESPLNSGTTETPFKTTDTEKRKLSGSTGYTSKVYKTVHETGRATASAVKQYAKLNGTTKLTFTDTQFASAYGSGTALRRALSLEAGFNQKQVAVYSNMHIRAADISGLYSANNWNPPQDSLQRVYGLTKNVFSQLKLMNTGSYFNSKVSIKLYAPTANIRNPATALKEAFPSSFEYSATTPTDAIPLKYAFSSWNETADRTTGLMDPKVSLDDSPAFDRRYKHVKTFSKTLKPGDVWDFTYKQHAGSGVRLDQIATIRKLENLALVGDLIVIEHHGVLCEAVEALDTTASYIGTSPSWLQVQHRIGHESVLSSTSAPDMFIGPATGGLDYSQYQVRVFTDKDEQGSSARRVNYDVSQIGNPGEADKSIFIPVTTNTDIDYARERSEV